MMGTTRTTERNPKTCDSARHHAPSSPFKGHGHGSKFQAKRPSYRHYHDSPLEVICLAVLYGYETWSFTLEVSHKIRAFETIQEKKKETLRTEKLT
jgi:hypothetical protein